MYNVFRKSRTLHIDFRLAISSEVKAFSLLTCSLSNGAGFDASVLFVSGNFGVDPFKPEVDAKGLESLKSRMLVADVFLSCCTLSLVPVPTAESFSSSGSEREMHMSSSVERRASGSLRSDVKTSSILVNFVGSAS